MKRLNEIPDNEIRIIGNLTLKRLLIVAVFLILGILMGSFLKNIFKYLFYLLVTLIGILVSRDSKENFQRNQLYTYLVSFYRDKRKYFPLSEKEQVDKKGKSIPINRTTKVLPQIKIEQDCFETETGYLDIYEIEPCDVFKLNAEDKNRKIIAYDQFLKGFNHDFKIINTKSKNVFDKQINELKYLLEKETNEAKRKVLINKIREFKMLEETTSKKAFYIVIFADSIFELNQIKEKLEGQFNETKLYKLSIREKIEIQAKLMSVGNYKRG